MSRFRTADVRTAAFCRPATDSAPRANGGCRRRASGIIGFALTLLLMSGALPVAVVSFPLAAPVSLASATADDSLQNFTSETALLRWRQGSLSWADLRRLAVGDQATAAAVPAELPPAPAVAPSSGIWAVGGLRVLHLGPGSLVRRVASQKSAAGHVKVIHDLDLGSGIQALAVDAAGLGLLLDAHLEGRLLLDRCGRPALDVSRAQVGAEVLEKAPWNLGVDWSGTIAVLDSGCDTAHGDLGDPPDDDNDGPPPAVGDAADWYPADWGWSLSQGYKVVGWHDVTDDFPLAAGPWDYHYHGTALASVAAGSGSVNPVYRGIAPAARLTVVKFYDFDGLWRTWAGDFLAACAWTLDNAAQYRVRTVLCAVNWDEDLGISAAMDAFLAAGILPVGAMGNQGSDSAGPGFPARLPAVLTVGACNDAVAVAAYSGRGTAVVAKPDLLAPGGGLLASRGRITAADNEPDDSYSGRVGTSLAAAHAAGSVFTLGEALRDAGLVMPPAAPSAAALRGVMLLTADPVTLAETADGTGVMALPVPAQPDTVQGWGRLRLDAAVEAIRLPLSPGQTQWDTLTAVYPVCARRLITVPGGSYRLEAVPAGGLDVRVEVADPLELGLDTSGAPVLRADFGGSGQRETLDLVGPVGGWISVAVKALQGQGQVAISLIATDSPTAPGAVFTLPGALSGDPNVADLDGDGDPSLILPSRVGVDQTARSLNVTDLAGNARPGWPVFVYPDPSSQGGLGRPLAWNLDGVPGDEIVVASQFGSVYFCSGTGSVEEVPWTVNLPLQGPVGMLAADDKPLVAVAAQSGEVRIWEDGPVLRASRRLGHSHPLAPAVGIFEGQAGEALVLACRDGFITVLDQSLRDLPGWPKFLAHNLTLPPVLLDRDGDRFHEIAVPVWAGLGDDLVVRLFHADGTPAPGDSTVLAPPAGGQWLKLSSASVGGAYAADGLSLDLVGLMDNGLAGESAAWAFGLVRLTPSGQVQGEIWPGFSVSAIADQSRLTLDASWVATPLAYGPDSGGEVETLALTHFRWQDLLFGFASLPGGGTQWLRGAAAGVSLEAREPADMGGVGSGEVTGLGAMLVRRGHQYLRVGVRNEQVCVLALPGMAPAFPAWMSSRADGRNTGAAALSTGASGVALQTAGGGGLRAFPNPSTGRIFLAPRGGDPEGRALLEVFDVRGRRLVRREVVANQGGWLWDGRNAAGRPLPAGVYLAAVQQGGTRAVTRITLTR